MVFFLWDYVVWEGNLGFPLSGQKNKDSIILLVFINSNIPQGRKNRKALMKVDSPSFLVTTIGLDKIEFLQSHENQDIYQKAFDLIEHYFGVEDDDSSLAPQVDETQQQFIFQQPEAPMEGFQL